MAARKGSDRGIRRVPGTDIPETHAHHLRDKMILHIEISTGDHAAQGDARTKDKLNIHIATTYVDVEIWALERQTAKTYAEARTSTKYIGMLVWNPFSMLIAININSGRVSAIIPNGISSFHSLLRELRELLRSAPKLLVFCA
jgi:hypothetical protein